MRSKTSANRAQRYRKLQKEIRVKKHICASTAHDDTATLLLTFRISCLGKAFLRKHEVIKAKYLCVTREG